MIDFSIELCSHVPRESLAVYQTSLKRDDIRVRAVSTPQKNSIAVGSVEFCSKILPRQSEIINFYPSFLKNFFGRQITLCEKKDIPTGSFVKSATSFKKFEPFVISDLTMVENGVYWCSEVVTFVNEWRYYIANGKQITSGWYLGNDENSEAPKLDIKWPEKFSAAVDFGMTDDGRLLLVESHPPFACGWYGENHFDYVHWLITSWKTNSWINL